MSGVFENKEYLGRKYAILEKNCNFLIFKGL